MTILSGTRNHRNVFLAEKFFRRFQKIFSNEKDALSAATVLLANTYGLSGDFHQLKILRDEMNRSKLGKTISISSTVYQGELIVKFTR